MDVTVRQMLVSLVWTAINAQLNCYYDSHILHILLYLTASLKKGIYLYHMQTETSSWYTNLNMHSTMFWPNQNLWYCTTFKFTSFGPHKTNYCCLLKISDVKSSPFSWFWIRDYGPNIFDQGRCAPFWTPQITAQHCHSTIYTEHTFNI